LGIRPSARRARGDPRLIHRLPDPMAADGQRYANPDASICEARASACVSIYSRIFVTLPFRTVMAKTQWSSNVLFVALIFPSRRRRPEPGLPALRIRGALGMSFPPLRTPSEAHPPIPRARGACGQRPVLARDDPFNVFGTNATRPCLSPGDCCKEILHNLDTVLSAHKNFLHSRIGSCPDLLHG